MSSLSTSFEELVSPENLFFAFDEFKRGKRNKEDVMDFERNLEENIFELARELVAKTYAHGSYDTFAILDPKFRIISKAQVKDRIVHHALFNYFNAIFDKQFIHHSYSSRVGKGTHLGVDNLYKMMRKASRNFSQNTYALKCDIRRFFANIDHGILLNLIKKKVKEEDILWLTEAVISSFAGGGVQPKGIPLGNVTSQIFANIYLHELDVFVKRVLREHFYVRYADDFVILHRDEKHLAKLIEILDMFLRDTLLLKLHPHKIVVRKFSQGIDFLGYVCFPHYRIVRTATKRRMLKKLRAKITELHKGKIEFNDFNRSLQSYLGLLEHASRHNPAGLLFKNGILQKPAPYELLSGVHFCMKANFWFCTKSLRCNIS